MSSEYNRDEYESESSGFGSAVARYFFGAVIGFLVAVWMFADKIVS